MSTSAFDIDDTIAAIASPAGAGLAGIVRISGPGTVACLRRCFQPSLGHEPWWSTPTARVFPGQMMIPRDDAATEAALPVELYFWPNERSYTRQLAAEIHTIGSLPLLQSALGRLCAAGCRLARPGEFTMRSFLAGRLDLAQAEAVLGVIDAADDRQLKVALRQLAGGLSSPLAKLRDTLLDLLADLEAGLDFVEEDIQFVDHDTLTQRLGEAAEIIRETCRRLRERTTTEAFRVVLTGPPNAGKSSLLNALVGHDTAMVSQVAGTTRDYLTAAIDIDGFTCHLVDTAGIDTGLSPTAVDRLAMDASRQQVHDADLCVVCIDSSKVGPGELPWQPPPSPREIFASTKCDLVSEAPKIPGAIATSAVTGGGLTTLRREIATRLNEMQATESDLVGMTALRCGESLRLAGELLASAQELAEQQSGEELIAAELRCALNELGKIVGTVYTEDVLDRIFSRFCIGK